MSRFHRYLGMLVVLLFVVVLVAALVLRVLRRDETPVWLWVVQHWTENLLMVQAVTGVILLLLGRRAAGMPTAWLHYLYGSIFPLVAIIGGRIAGLRREAREYVGLGWGAFFAFALTFRGIQTACGPAMEDLARCVGW
ncbi:MAG: hypothetical protein ACOCT8_03370 [Actinomycetota bacterium]